MNPTYPEVGTALAAIREDNSRAVEILERGIQEGQATFLAGLADWISAALSGVVIDPENVAAPKDNPSIQRRLVKCQDVMSQSLCKARGIMFVMSQVQDAELEDDEKQGWAIWAVSDYLRDAHNAMSEAWELERQKVVR